MATELLGKEVQEASLTSFGILYSDSYHNQLHRKLKISLTKYLNLVWNSNSVFHTSKLSGWPNARKKIQCLFFQISIVIITIFLPASSDTTKNDVSPFFSFFFFG